MESNIENVRKKAQAELDIEDFRQQVDAMKKTLRAKRKFWVRLFPWKITITRRY